MDDATNNTVCMAAVSIKQGTCSFCAQDNSPKSSLGSIQHFTPNIPGIIWVRNAPKNMQIYLYTFSLLDREQQTRTCMLVFGLEKSLPFALMLTHHLLLQFALINGLIPHKSLIGPHNLIFHAYSFLSSALKVL